jgi:hypothetical protein
MPIPRQTVCRSEKFSLISSEMAASPAVLCRRAQRHNAETGAIPSRNTEEERVPIMGGGEMALTDLLRG